MKWPMRWQLHYGFMPKTHEVDALEEMLNETFRDGWTGAELCGALDAHAEEYRLKGHRPKEPAFAELKTLIIRGRYAKRVGQEGLSDPLASYKRRLDNIRMGGYSQCPRLEGERNRPGSACHDCERDGLDQAWCIICQPRDTADKAQLRAYADSKAIAYRTTASVIGQKTNDVARGGANGCEDVSGIGSAVDRAVAGLVGTSEW